MVKTAKSTIDTEREADSIRAKLVEHEEMLAGLETRIAENDAAIEHHLLRQALGDKPDDKALATLQTTEADLARQQKHGAVVADGLRAILETWEAQEGERAYSALVPRVKALRVTGTDLEREYLESARATVAIGRKLNAARFEHMGLINQMYSAEQEFTNEARLRTQLHGPERVSPAPAFPLSELLLDPGYGEELDSEMIARFGSPYWRDVLGIPVPIYANPGPEDDEIEPDPDDDGVVETVLDDDGLDAA